MSPCPSPETLDRLGEYATEDERFAALERHIEDCPACQEFLEQRARASSGGVASILDILPLPVIGDLAFERRLGRGGMGVVYLAWEARLARQVAVKLVPGDPTAGAREQERWLREARTLCRIRDRNVVQLYRVGEAGPWRYLVFEYVPGGSLERRLDGAVAPRDAARLVATVAAAVEAVHRAGVLHLDLKPANILLDGPADDPWPRARPLVADFGIARPLAGSEAAEITLAGPQGTPSYMAPEQARADRDAIGPATDVYALGAILYRLLTGGPPFRATTAEAVMAQVREQEPVPPRRLDPTIPRDLETVALKCLGKDPARRYADAAAVADDLDRWLDGRPIAARPVSPPERAWRWCRRRPGIAALASALLLTLSAGVVGLFLLWRRAEAEHTRAEADFGTMKQILGQLVEQTVPGNHLQVLDSKSLIAALRQTRKRLLGVAAGRPDDHEIARQLALVNRGLGVALLLSSRWDEARPVLDEAVRGYERVIRHDPHDRAARLGLIIALGNEAKAAGGQNDDESCTVYLWRAFHEVEDLVRIRPDGQLIETLADTRNALAHMSARRGDLEQARSLMQANRELLRHVPAGSESAEVAAWRVFTLSDYDRFGPIPASRRPVGSGGGRPADPSPLAEYASPEAERLPAGDWAELAARALRSASPPGLGAQWEHEAGYRFMILLATLSADQRHLGRLDSARQTADRMLALGRLLAGRHPDVAASHLAVSEAWNQFYKNDCQVRDEDQDVEAIVRYLRSALDAALRAQAVEPNNKVARIAVDRLQQKLWARLPSE